MSARKQINKMNTTHHVKHQLRPLLLPPPPPMSYMNEKSGPLNESERRICCKGARINKMRSMVSVRSSMKRRSRGILDQAIISLILFSIISDQSVINIVLTTSRHLGKSNEYNRHIQQGKTTLLDNTPTTMDQLSLVKMVGANPAPNPSPAKSRSATSASHKVPPMNGSIFGKRSVMKSGTRSQQRANKDNGMAKHNTNNDNVNNSDVDDRQQMMTMMREKASREENEQIIQSATSIKPPSRELEAYNNLITDTIEDFLARDIGGKWC